MSRVDPFEWPSDASLDDEIAYEGERSTILPPPPDGAWYPSSEVPLMGEPLMPTDIGELTDQIAKQDLGKTKWSTLLARLPNALARCVEVLEYGESKYGTGETWRTVRPIRYRDAALRHMVKRISGHVVNESDGGTLHEACAIVDLLFALENEENDGRR